MLGAGVAITSHVAPFLRSRRGAILCFVLALVAFAVDSLAWPLYPGRDAGTYLDYYADMWHAHPVYPELMLYRTPLAPLAYGIPLRLGGAFLAEVATGVAFAVSVVAFAAAAAEFSAAAGALVAGALLLFPSYGAIFEGVGSDSVFAFVLSLWTLALVRSSRTPRLGRFAALGAGVGVLVLARPSALVLIPIALFPMVLPLPWRRRLAAVGVFAAAIAVSLVAWAGYNDVRYNDFVISRTANAQIPLFRAFVVDRLVRPDNGPASEKLAAAVRRDLLTKQPYKAYHVTLKMFFSSGSTRMWADLIGLSDREWGWGSDYSVLRSVGLEAVRKHPRQYVRSVATTVVQELSWPFLQPTSVRDVPGSAPATISVHGRRLPKPTEGEPIPASHLWWLASTPDGHIGTDFSSFTRPHFVFRTPQQAARAADLTNEVNGLIADVPNRNGSPLVERWLARWTRVFPRAWMWIVVGLLGTLIRRPKGALVLMALCLVALAIVVGSALGEPTVLQYRVPVDPLLFIFASGALLGTPAARGDRKRSLRWQAWRRSTPPTCQR